MVDTIPEDIRQFILQHIDSIAEWEALLLMRANPSIEWNREAIAQRLYIGQAEAAQLLQQLAGQGLLVQNAAYALYHYAPTSADMEPIIERTAAFYARSLVPITHLIHSKPKTRIQKFADAFRIRKD